MTTREELYERAQELDIEGRSNMDKAELEAAIAEADNAPAFQTDGTTAGSNPGVPGEANADNVGDESYTAEAANEEPDFSNVAPESVSAALGNLHGGVLPADGKINAPMEDPVGTAVTHREELAEAMTFQRSEEDQEAFEAAQEEERQLEADSDVLSDEEKDVRADLGLTGITTTANGELASSGAPSVTHAEILKNRAVTAEARETFDQ